MNSRLFYAVFVILLAAGVFLVKEIIHLEKIPEDKSFALYLSNVSNGVEKTKKLCLRRYKWTERARKSTNPSVEKAVWAMDRLMLYRDSAELYFQHMEYSKNNSDSARNHFNNYIAFSNRFRKEVVLTSGIRESKNYVLFLHERLPGRKLPFTSASEIQLVTLLLQDDFYIEMERAFKELSAFAGY